MDAVADRAGVPVDLVDVDASPEVARHYMVKAVPTVILVRDGETVWRGSGASALPGLQTALDSL